MSERIGIALIGATGTVGQKVIRLMENNPNFYIKEVVASERSAGKVYGDWVHWREGGVVPDAVANLTLKSFEEVTSDYAISSIPSEQAEMIEGGLAKKGVHVISNSSHFRMGANIPLVVPEINKSHFALVNQQDAPGKIITNPNCSTVFLALGLAPIYRHYSVESVSVFTLQAISGAGYPGVSSADILGNTIPNIGGEEEKIEQEAQKILGTVDKACDFEILANVNRVPVDHGHSITMHINLKESVTVEEIRSLYRNCEQEFPAAYKLYTSEFQPQPKFCLGNEDNRTHIGRIRTARQGKQLSLISMGHNLIRGAAGAAILNLEEFHQFLNNQ